AASAAGLDLGKDFIEKQAIERLVPRIMDRVAVKMSAEIAEKWTARLIPLLSAGAGGALNYYFVRAWDAARRNTLRTASGWFARRKFYRRGWRGRARRCLR